MAQLVVMLGRQLAQDAKEAAEAAREAQEDADLDQGDEDQVPGRETGGLA